MAVMVALHLKGDLKEMSVLSASPLKRPPKEQDKQQPWPELCYKVEENLLFNPTSQSSFLLLQLAMSVFL